MNSGNWPAAEPEDLAVLVQERMIGRCHVNDLQILVESGGIILRGAASTYYAKQVAQQVVMELTTLPIRANEIQVH
jgi:hypothetical protein